MTDTPQPRTAAGRELVEDEPRLVTGEHSMLARVLAIEAEVYDAAMIDAFDDVQRADRAEAAAQAEGSLDPKPTHIWNGVDGHDCQDCPPDSMWKCDWYAHGGLPTEHGIPVRTVAEQRRDADKFVNSLPLPTSGAEGSLDVERLVTEAVNAWIDDDTPGLDEKEWRVGLVNAVVARLATEKPAQADTPPPPGYHFTESSDRVAVKDAEEHSDARSDSR